MDKPDKNFTSQREQQLAKIRHFCAYRDRCHAEVRSKLLEMKVYGDELEEMMAELITDGFLNEERYARSYVRGKFRINGWGRNKIIPALKLKKIHSSLIKQALNEIDEDEYLEHIKQVIDKKYASMTDGSGYEKRQKLIRFAMLKGFELDIIEQLIDEISD
ncbi:MAG TPA: hypothetical protein DCX89_09730 [Saprospirales bacterium]|nr:hypothetical protein [Saprospirales bacterium]HAY72156.1 hypothetical protein [Saprospirales bacterium]HRQ29235.1 regulatory protein RecX [Saprospiraceae bacterium]